MQLMSPLQISDPFGSFPHSPTMDNYPKLEEMMLLSNGAPQFLGAAGTPEGSGSNSSSSSGGGGGGGSNSGSSAFNPQGEPSERPYEHLSTGKRWSASRLNPLRDDPSVQFFLAWTCIQTLGMGLGFLSIPHGPGDCVRGMPGDTPSPPSLPARGGQLVCFGWRAQAAWVAGGGEGLF